MALSKHVVARLAEAVGARNVITDPLELRAYEYDGALERGEPDVVVFPTSTTEVSEILRFCSSQAIPATPRGSGTSLSGGPVPLCGGVLLEFARMDKLLEVDLENQRAVCQPGYLNFDFMEELADVSHFYAPDPSSQKVCTMGGNVAENSGGPHCLKYGVTTNHVTGLTVVLADGEVAELGSKAIEDAGYDLRGLIIGSEGTLAVVTQITCRMLPDPESVVTMLAIFDSLIAASEAVSGIIASGMIPATLEMMDRPIIRAVEEAVHAGYPLDAEAVLIIELDGMAAGMDDQVRQVTEVCRAKGAIRFQVAQSEEERELLWAGRKGAFGAVASIAPNKMVTDIAVPRTELPKVLAEVMEIGKRHGLDVGNVFHAGDGNLHPQLLFDDRDEDQVRRVMAADKEIAKLALRAGGVLTGEHGIGSQKAYAMPLMYAPQDLAAMRAIKRLFDPDGILNPGKVLPEAAEAEAQLAPLALSRELPSEPGATFAVESYEEAAAALAEATREGRSIVPVGGRTKVGDVGESLALGSLKLDAVVDYDWENLTVTVQAGMRVAQVQEALAEHRQFVPITAPFPEEATIGGIIAANSSGPLRYGLGEVRDVLLGVKFAGCNGQIITSGSKTVKNVAGYDVKKLLVGSFGSLGMLLEATFRTLPLPAAEQCLVARVGTLSSALAIARAIRLSHLLPSAIEVLNGEHWAIPSGRLGLDAGEEDAWRMVFCLRGCEDDVDEMRVEFSRIAATHEREIVSCSHGEDAAQLVRAISEPSRVVEAPFYALKLVVPPGQLSGPLQAPVEHAMPLTLRPMVRASAGSGIAHILISANPAEGDVKTYVSTLADKARAAGGWLTADAPAGRAHAVVRKPEPDPLSAALKREFDPAGILPPAP
jgi:D-lactate dehydrogenase (cytochrome)